MIINQESELVDVTSLKPHPSNPRIGDLEAVKESIVANGFFGALIVQRSTNFILAGNHRYKAAVELEMKQVPVIWIDVDDDRALRILLADNRTSDAASYDESLLYELLNGLSDIVGTGYQSTDLEVLMMNLQFSNPEPKEPGPSTGAIRGRVVVLCAMSDLELVRERIITDLADLNVELKQ